MSKGTLKICSEGHRFYKSSDCPTCPVCDEARKPGVGLLSTVAAPARRALQRIGVDTVQKLSNHSEREILALHGMGPDSLPKLREALRVAGLSFKK